MIYYYYITNNFINQLTEVYSVFDEETAEIIYNKNGRKFKWKKYSVVFFPALLQLSLLINIALIVHCILYIIFGVVINVICGLFLNDLPEGFNFAQMQKESLMFIFLFGIICLALSRNIIVQNNLSYVRAVKNVQKTDDENQNKQ